MVGRSNVGKSSLINALVRQQVARAYFDPVRLKADPTTVRGVRLQPDRQAALLLVDARHPGLESDIGAWQWLKASVARTAIVATKIDKLPRGERIRATRELQSVFDVPVLPVSAVTGEGLDELWTLIDTLANPDNPNNRPNSSSRLPSSRAATAPPAVRTRRRQRR